MKVWQAAVLLVGVFLLGTAVATDTPDTQVPVEVTP